MNGRRAIELFVVTTSALAIAAVAIFLAVDGISSRDDPPDPAVTLHAERARSTTHGWVIPATVENRGHTAAEAVALEASASVDGSEEVSAIDVDFLPAETSVEIEFGFSAEPDGPIEIRVLAYRLP